MKKEGTDINLVNGSGSPWILIFLVMLRNISRKQGSRPYSQVSTGAEGSLDQTPDDDNTSIPKSKPYERSTYELTTDVHVKVNKRTLDFACVHSSSG